MLGSNQKNICDVKPPVVDKSCIEINDWNSQPQSKGCIKYKGKYYINLVTGNTSIPDKGLLKGTYAVGSEDYCQVIKYFATNQNTCDMSNTFMKFFTGIGEYSQCAEDKVFECDEFIIFKNNDIYELHKSLIENNTRHPHDRDAWKNLGQFSNILNLIFDESEGYQLTLPYWEECLGKNCATLYKECSLVVEKIDSGEVDNCGNPIFNELIFESLIDKNTDRPSLGAVKTIPTWRGPFTDSEFMNRHIGKTVNGDKIKSNTDIQLVTSIDFCDKFEWIDVQSGKLDENDQPILVKRLCSKPVGTDENGKSIDLNSDTKLLSQSAVCDKFEWVDTPTDECEVDCDKVTIKQFCPKPVGRDENNIIINNGTGSHLISYDAPIAPLQWVDVDQEDCLPNCEHPTKKYLTVCTSDGLELVENCIQVKPANNSIIVEEDGVKVGQIGVDRNGNPVNAGDCLVTCSTDIYVTSIDDIGSETTLTLSNGTSLLSSETDITVQSINDTGTEICITLTNGAVICGVKIDNDDHVVSTNTVTNGDGSTTITLTMKSGATHTINIPKAPDSFVDGITINASGQVALSRNNGLPDLTAQIIFPASSGTDLSHTINVQDGTLLTTSSSGNDAGPTPFQTHDLWPSAYVRVGVVDDSFSQTGGTVPLNSANDDNLKGGFSYNGSGGLVVPKSMTYEVIFDNTFRANQAGATADGKARSRIFVNGVAIAGFGVTQRPWHWGFTAPNVVDPKNDSGAFSERQDEQHLDLNAGDVITVEVDRVSLNEQFTAVTLRVVPISKS